MLRESLRKYDHSEILAPECETDNEFNRKNSLSMRQGSFDIGVNTISDGDQTTRMLPW